MSDVPKQNGGGRGTRMRLSFWPTVRLGIICAIALAGMSVTACGDDDTGGDPQDGKVRVVTTLPLFADFVRQIGGDRVEVTALLPSGSDPHTWEPAPRDVQKIAEADVAFANGLDLEPAAIKVLQANLRHKAELVELAVASSEMPIVGFDTPLPNPHLWLDPDKAQNYARTISESLIFVDPENEPYYEQNRERYSRQIGDITSTVREKLASIPDERRKLVTTHDAFQYFASFLGLESVAVVVAGPGQEPSPEDIADLARAIRDQAVPAVFVEPQISAESDTLRQAADDAGVQVCTLYSDSLDEKVTSYIELMRFNADELARCLGGGDGG